MDDRSFNIRWEKGESLRDLEVRAASLAWDEGPSDPDAVWAAARKVAFSIPEKTARVLAMSVIQSTMIIDDSPVLEAQRSLNDDI
jgi:hypothetical protein